jgi:nicotinate-nucleotide--dimethylbenzimidazole phosphoribosyltransferase
MTPLLEATLARIEPADADCEAAARSAFDAKTKPRGSLGRLEDLAAQICAIRRTTELDRLRSVVVVAAGDHGVAVEGVSAYPSEVTRQMLANFDADGAAVCVLARRAGAGLHVVDAGVGTPTGNIAETAAMSGDAAVASVERGIECANELALDGVDVVGLGEMGIGNSTVAAAVAAALLGVDPAQVCGRGTGLDDDGLARKVDVVRRALRANAGREPLAVLAGLGGFELAFLCGLALGTAAQHMVVLLDGFISSTAALLAARLRPAASASMISAHLSPEPGHRLVLDALALEPLLDLELRLGEGSGAALALPLLDAAVALLTEMATFAEAGVTDAGR